MTNIELLKVGISAKDVTIQSLRAKRDELDGKVEAIRASIARENWERQKLVDRFNAEEAALIGKSYGKR
jgi:SMC interacting uncharacterized protein involved in chromosome segregation